MEKNQSSYWVKFVVKDGQDTIKNALESIILQTITPRLICIVDDGSKDSTPKILEEFKQKYNDLIHVITLEDKGYDIRRIVHNWNRACEFIEKNNYEFDFMLTGTEDVIFPKKYVEKLVQEINTNKKLVVVSGTRGLKQSDYMSFPEGAGRLVEMKFFRKIGLRFPPFYGYEPWILYKALQMNYEIKKINNLKYSHIRKFGSKHNFIEYGPSMRCLGYHPIFVLARILRNIFRKNTGISKRASIKMLLDYVNKSKWKNDPYYHFYEPDFRKFVRTIQVKRILKQIGFNK